MPVADYLNPLRWFRASPGFQQQAPADAKVPARPPLGPADDGNSSGAYDQSSRSAEGSLLGYGLCPADNVREWLKCLDDPVVAACRQYALGPLRVATPTLEARDGTPDRIAKFVENVTRPLLASYATDAVWSVDLGWQPFQNVFSREDGKYTLPRILPGLVENSCGVWTDKDSGDPIGIQWHGIDLYGHKGFFVTNERRAQVWTGRSRLKNVLLKVHQAREADESTGGLFKKNRGVVAGVGFPPGKGKKNGIDIDRSEQALDFAKKITSGTGYFAYPTLGGLTDEKILSMPPGDLLNFLKASLWQFTFPNLGETGPAISAATEEKRYLDEQKCLGYYVPPRAILSGETGTFSSTEAAGGFGTSMNESVNVGIWDAFNKGPVDSLLALNFGEEYRGAVWWKPEPLEDAQGAWDRSIFTALVQAANPQAFLYFYKALGLRAIAERNGLKVDETAVEQIPQDPALAQQQAGQPGGPENTAPAGDLTPEEVSLANSVADAA